MGVTPKASSAVGNQEQDTKRCLIPSRLFDRNSQVFFATVNNFIKAGLLTFGFIAWKEPTGTVSRGQAFFGL